MVYTAALPFGHGVSVLSEEESVVEMIGRFLFQHKPREMSSARRGSVDSYDETENSPCPDWDSHLEEEQQLLHQALTQQMERCLTEAKTSSLHCQLLLLPRHMITRIGHHILRSAAQEPCGLRGASIKLYVDGKDGLKSAGSILPDPSVTPTFELSVVFKVDNEGWLPLRHIFDTSKALKLRAECRLVKRKLYSSASPVVHDYS
ncbi:DNA damage-inducible transcript 4-like protein [Austrofundulus limnaeus]|uniref:DNA damage-inducible transcript 4-like protein n=1 Tax=Austrofundulus limnaeus TaxID=52670 RepID=A0A2I4D3U2_AUSLI|nr:PREDICTED: DNA damage-inducible transcript 4-like protein [Austrofundulus limnaeus]